MLYFNRAISRLTHQPRITLSLYGVALASAALLVLITQNFENATAVCFLCSLVSGVALISSLAIAAGSSLSRFAKLLPIAPLVLIPVALNWLYCELFDRLAIVSPFAGITEVRNMLWVVLWLVMVYFTAIVLPLYCALRLTDAPRPFRRICSLAIRPNLLLHAFFCTVGIALLLFACLCVAQYSLMLWAYFNLQIPIEHPVAALLVASTVIMPLVALLLIDFAAVSGEIKFRRAHPDQGETPNGTQSISNQL